MDHNFIPLLFTKKILDYVFVEDCPFVSTFLRRISKTNLSFILDQVKVYHPDILEDVLGFWSERFEATADANHVLWSLPNLGS